MTVNLIQNRNEEENDRWAKVYRSVAVHPSGPGRKIKIILATQQPSQEKRWMQEPLLTHSFYHLLLSSEQNHAMVKLNVTLQKS